MSESHKFKKKKTLNEFVCYTYGNNVEISNKTILPLAIFDQNLFCKQWNVGCDIKFLVQILTKKKNRCTQNLNIILL